MRRSKDGSSSGAPAWKPVMWQAEYRGQTIWVEEEYATGHRWAWHVAGAKSGDADDRAKTKELAQAAGVACVDALLGGVR